MTKAARGRYTLEFKQEAVRLVESSQSQAEAARNGDGLKRKFLPVRGHITAAPQKISTRNSPPVIGPFYTYLAVFRRPCNTCK